MDKIRIQDKHPGSASLLSQRMPKSKTIKISIKRSCSSISVSFRAPCDPVCGMRNGYRRGSWRACSTRGRLSYVSAWGWCMTTEYTQSGNGRFLACIPSCGKISPGWWGWGGCTPTPFHSIYYHIQSCSVRSSREGRYTPCISCTLCAWR